MNDMTHRPSIEAPQLRTLLLTDLCDSTTLIERIGDVEAATLFRDHDRLVLDLQQRWRGRLIDRSDGMLLLFERPIDGLGFALDYMRGLREMGSARKLELKARAGLHVGEVLTWRNSDEAVQVGAKPLEVEGLAKPMAARLMAMARPGQILLSAVAEPLAHRAARELGERGQHLLWKSHGRWRFKGVPDSQQIYEVGEPGIAPLRMPPHTPKAWRDIPLWRRPAALAAEAAVIAGIGVGVWFATRPAPAIAFNQRDWVVVADLRNLTGQTVLDDSLEQAFRISLEQSRYVNVLSDLKARDTLARMQLKPDTVLDRAIASEIALRDGARAVILPTVAEVGGKVRVSAEVIDPNTQATLYVGSEDGKGVGSTLDSIDAVTSDLRKHLGETLASVQKDSMPLPKVATANLDALRAYALGQQAYAQGNSDDALTYFKRAVGLDADFALAYVGIMRIHVSRVETAQAKESLAMALKLRKHLAPRDALYLDAWAAELASPGTAAEKWDLLAKMYPDYFAGHANLAWSLLGLGRYREALAAVVGATQRQNPLRAVALDQQGRIKLALNDMSGALASFRSAEEGARKPSRQLAAAHAAARDFTKARSIVAALPEGELINRMEAISIAVDQGQLKDALRLSKEAEKAAAARSPFWRDLFSTVALSLHVLDDPTRLRPKDFETNFRRSLQGVTPSADDGADRLYFAAATAYLAQYAGKPAVARALLEEVDRVGQPFTESRVKQLIAVVRANQAVVEGNPERGARALSALADGTEQFQLHVALRTALAKAGKADEAASEDRWLQRNRGLAYAEQSGAYVFQPLNVFATAARPVGATAPRSTVAFVGD